MLRTDYSEMETFQANSILIEVHRNQGSRLNQEKRYEQLHQSEISICRWKNVLIIMLLVQNQSKRRDSIHAL